MPTYNESELFGDAPDYSGDLVFPSEETHSFDLWKTVAGLPDLIKDTAGKIKDNPKDLIRSTAKWSAEALQVKGRSFLNAPQNFGNMFKEAPKGFNPYEYVKPEYAEHGKAFAFAKSEQDVRRIELDIDEELDRKKRLSEAGIAGVIGYVGTDVLADPFNLLPIPFVGSAFKGGSLLKGAASIALANGLQSTASESFRQLTEYTRTYGESANNIAADTILGGVFGAGVGAFGKWNRRAASDGVDLLGQYEKFDRMLTVPHVGEAPSIPLTGRPLPGSIKDVRLKAMEAALKNEATDSPVNPIDLLTPKVGNQTPKTTALTEGIPRQIDLFEAGSVDLPESILLKDIDSLDLNGGATVGHLLDEVAKDANLVQDEKTLLGKALNKTLGYSPMMRLMTSPSTEARRIAQALAETPLRLAKNADGVATDLPVETIARQSRGNLWQALKGMDGHFDAYRKRLAGTGEAPLNKGAFKEAVSMAMRRGDASFIPEVSKAAKQFRDLVFDPLKNRAIKAGLLPKKVKAETATSYLMRRWNVEAINADLDGFREVNLKWLLKKETQHAAQIQETLNGLKVDLKKAKKEKNLESIQWAEENIIAVQKRLDEALKRQRGEKELNEVVDRLITRINGTPGGRIGYDAMIDDWDNIGAKISSDKLRAGPTQKRVYDIPDEMVERYLDNDIESLAKIYDRSLAGDVALAEKFKNKSIDDILDSIRKNIAKDYEAQRLKAGSPKAVEALHKRMNNDLKDAEALFHRLRGTYGLPADPTSGFVRLGRGLRAWNYLTLMGGVVLNSLPDMARPVMVHGLKPFLGDAVVPWIKATAGLGSKKVYGQAADQIRDAGVALDRVLDSRMQSFTELYDDMARVGKYEKLAGAAEQKISGLFGINAWTQWMKEWAGLTTVSQLIRRSELVALGKATKKDVTALADSYIDEGMAKRIAGQFKKYGQDDEGLRLANTTAWDDQEAAQVFRGAVGRDVNRIIVTPGVGDLPLFMSTELGKTIMQFRSFFIASNQRVLLSGLQQRDGAVLTGLVMATGLGIISARLTDVVKGRERELSTAGWIKEGIDRAGVMGALMEYNAVLEKITRGTVGLSALTGAPPMSRYASRNVVDALAGPSVGRVEDVLRLTGVGLDMVNPMDDEEGKPDLTKADIRAVRRMVPMNNLFYLRWLFDQGEDGLKSQLGYVGDDD